MKIYNKNLWPATLAKCAIIVLIGMFLFFGIDRYSKAEIDSTIRQTVNMQKRLIELQMESFKMESDTIADLIFDIETKKLMYDAKNGKDPQLIRDELLARYLPLYEKLQRHSLRHLQFHTPDGRSFLRVHKPDTFGDSLLFRPSIESMIHTHKPIYGFEVGRYLGAYRAIYPLFYRMEFVGSVEISFSFAAMKTALERVSHGLSSYMLALNYDLLKRGVKNGMPSGYQKCFIDDKFVLDGALSKGSEIVKESGYKTSLLPYREFYTIFELLKGGKREIYTVSFIPLRLIDDGYGGYYIIVHKDDGAIAQVLSITHIAYFALGLFVLVSLVLTLMVHIYRLKAHAAEIDTLTGIYNRRGCMKRLKNGDKRYALLYIDIDHFKSINDRFGHDTGDEVLKEVARLITAHIRKDDVFCRHGGEEFLLFISNASKEQALKVAQKLRKHIELHKFEKVGHVTVSVGIAIREKNESIGSLISRADKNLYKAKEQGRNRVVTDDLQKRE